MARNNLWIDGLGRDRGTYRHITGHDLYDEVSTTRQLCNSNEMEDALIDALDKGMSAEEIADIQLGSF